MKTKTLKEMRELIKLADQNWKEIEGELSRDSKDSTDSSIPFSNAIMEKKEKLKNLLENIRNDLEVWLFSWDSSVVKEVCSEFLEDLLKTSEKLRLSYTFPGYVESFYILDTMEMTKR